MKPSALPFVEMSKVESAFGRLMHFWRKASGLSQEQLSDPLGVSTRHISFLETGRSKPSRVVAQTLADIFELSARDRAYLLAAAGFSADQSVFDCPELSVWLRRSMRVALERSEPAPAFVHDSYGRLLAVNRAWLAFFLPRVAPHLLAGEANICELMMNPEGLRPRLENGIALASGLALYITMETLQGDDPEGWTLLERLQASGSIPQNWQQLGRKLLHTSHYPLSLKTDGGVIDLTVYNDTLSSAPQLVQPRLLIGRIYRDDGGPVLTEAELAAAPAEHPLLYKGL
ncbi:DNA-binding transcriptional regulator, XRE-family HTH domain [Microbulbifer donghaiensis]|uniref:DNA-binding transcriptional regulator, XRE-family HTH domain n=1 Tax=Microbulbifer donghaiensis TaxID=494016 RepID=A0A1M5IFY4_9GAMM|nr:helix-turn-helix domain-containing protein [Microbulbifer donghaiensis]SHG26840.1 DNA-binding transcriptional regulator, XRE-family HTH domain [Microbulbifer donghaiensis]